MRKGSAKPPSTAAANQLALDYSGGVSEGFARQKRARIENFGIEFAKTSSSPDAYKCAVGWVFDVPAEFRDQLDIVYFELADKVANEATKKKLGLKKLDPSQRKYRRAWTRGVPPALSFSTGHIFYDPPGIRSLDWNRALSTLKRVVQIKDAVPDGAAAPDEVIESPGWVRFEVSHYNQSKITRREEFKLSQAQFAFFLQHGRFPPDAPS